MPDKYLYTVEMEFRNHTRDGIQTSVDTFNVVATDVDDARACAEEVAGAQHRFIRCVSSHAVDGISRKAQDA